MPTIFAHFGEAMDIDPISAIGRRRDSRLRVEVPAQLVTLSGQYLTTLRDLSQSGAGFSASFPVVVGQDVVLSWLNFECFGAVHWAHAGFAGIEFDDLLSEEALLTTRESVDQGNIKSAEQLAYEKAKDWYTGHNHRQRLGIRGC